MFEHAKPGPPKSRKQRTQMRSGGVLSLFCAALFALPVSAASEAAEPPPQPAALNAYLAGYSALMRNDFDATAKFMAIAYAGNPKNTELREYLIIAELARGNFMRGIELAKNAENEGYPLGFIDNFLIQIVLIRNSWFEPEDAAGQDIVIDILMGWNFVRGNKIGKAITRFDELEVLYKDTYLPNILAALTYAMVGDFQKADERFEQARITQYAPHMIERHKIARIQVLSQLERNSEALALFDEHFAPPLDPYLKAMRHNLDVGAPLAFQAIPNVNALLSEIYLSAAELAKLSGIDADWRSALVYARAAEFIDPQNLGAIVMNARLISDIGQPHLALESYERVLARRPSLYYTDALLGKADALSNMDNVEAAIAFLRAYNKETPNNFLAHWAQGDYLKSANLFEEAIKEYSKAISALDSNLLAAYWPLYYGRGISYERTGKWANAEKDFRKALEMEPNQPMVLNYLGYSLVEMRENLGKALDMIQRAVNADKDNGYITDSLAWAYFRLGELEKAVIPMEHAAELEPTDPIINDHLGDVYWAVGRKREAGYQWKRALLFAPVPEEEERIRRKLEIGLDEVLAEEDGGALQPTGAE